jgi:hypothetical protein
MLVWFWKISWWTFIYWWTISFRAPRLRYVVIQDYLNVLPTRSGRLIRQKRDIPKDTTLPCLTAHTTVGKIPTSLTREFMLPIHTNYQQPTRKTRITKVIILACLTFFLSRESLLWRLRSDCLTFSLSRESLLWRLRSDCLTFSLSRESLFWRLCSDCFTFVLSRESLLCRVSLNHLPLSSELLRVREVIPVTGKMWDNLNANVREVIPVTGKMWDILTTNDREVIPVTMIPDSNSRGKTVGQQSEKAALL